MLGRPLPQRRASAQPRVIRLEHPLDTPEGTLEALRMRTPTLADYAEIGKSGGDEVARGIQLVARLCDASIAEILSLSVTDFKAVMTEFNRVTCGAHA